MWFVLAGWWLRAFTLTVAYVCLLTPVGILMLNAMPAVVTLQRN